MQVRDAAAPHAMTASEFDDILMMMKWRRRDIEGVLALYGDPRMAALQACNTAEDNALLEKLRTDLQQQLVKVTEQMQQVPVLPRSKGGGRGHGGVWGCIRREGASEGGPEAVRQAVGGGCQSGWGRLLSPQHVTPPFGA